MNHEGIDNEIKTKLNDLKTNLESNDIELIEVVLHIWIIWYQRIMY